MPQFTEMRRPALWDDNRPRHSPSDGRPAPGTALARTVVLGYDGSEAARSAAFQAARAVGSRGCIVVVTAVPSADANELAQEGAPVGDPEQLVREAKALLRQDEHAVTTRLAEGDPVEALVAAAYETGADLIVVGVRDRGDLVCTPLGPVAERLVTHAPCSVLLERRKLAG